MTGTRLLTIIVPSSVFCHRISHHHYEEFSVRDACLLFKCDIVCDIIFLRDSGKVKIAIR
jgi:hypothetical protein